MCGFCKNWWRSVYSRLELALIHKQNDSFTFYIQRRLSSDIYMDVTVNISISRMRNTNVPLESLAHWQYTRSDIGLQNVTVYNHLAVEWLLRHAPTGQIICLFILFRLKVESGTDVAGQLCVQKQKWARGVWNTWYHLNSMKRGFLLLERNSVWISCWLQHVIMP